MAINEFLGRIVKGRRVANILKSNPHFHCLEENIMPEPGYLLVIGKGWTEAWYQLSKEEQESLRSKVEAVVKQAGAKWLIMCDSRWADEEIYDWGVLEYPDMETYQKMVKELEKVEWWRYFSAKTILGTKFEELWA